MIMHKLTYLVVLGCLFCACQTPSTGDKRVVAEANGKKLYHNELMSMFPDKYSVSDSLDMAQSFINNWIRKVILLEEAEKYISKDIDIQRLVDDYKASLILDNFEKKLVNTRLDTFVTQEEIELKYEETKEQFYLRSDIVRALYAKVPAKKTGLDKFFEEWKSKDLDQIRRYCSTNCSDSLLHLDTWYYKEDLKSVLPSKLAKKVTWKMDEIKQLNVNDHEYFLYVLETKKAQEASPLSFVKDKIVKLIIHERKKAILKNYQDKLFDEKINSKQVILH